MNKLNIINRSAVAALLLVVGLQTANAQGIRVHYKNGTVTDVPAALFDRMEPNYSKTTIDDGEDPNPNPNPNPDPNVDPWKIPDTSFSVEPLNPVNAAAAIALVQQAGMPVNLGTSAPSLNGAFSMKPLTLVASKFDDPEYNVDQSDVDDEAVFKFSGQSGNTIKVDMYDVDEDGASTNWTADFEEEGYTNGFPAYIVGSGNKFTIAFVIKVNWGDELDITGFLISGEVSGNAIKDMHYCEFEVDDNKVTGYAIIKDTDGNSTATTWAPKPPTSYNSRSKLARRMAPRRLAARQLATTTVETYSFTVYKTDGTSFSVTKDELDYVETYEGTFDTRITQQIPQEYLSKMATYMPIYSGSNAPTINGAFISHTHVPVYTSDGYTWNGTLADQVMNFTDQNKTKNTINYQYRQGSGSSDKTEMVVMGQGDQFTIFAVMNGTDSRDNATYKMAEIVSGTVTADGIKDFFAGMLMLEKNDPGNNLMSVGTYRIFKDDDGLAAKTTWSARLKAAATDADNQLSNISAK